MIFRYFTINSVCGVIDVSFNNYHSNRWRCTKTIDRQTVESITGIITWNSINFKIFLFAHFKSNLSDWTDLGNLTLISRTINNISSNLCLNICKISYAWIYVKIVSYRHHLFLNYLSIWHKLTLFILYHILDLNNLRWCPALYDKRCLKYQGKNKK